MLKVDGHSQEDESDKRLVHGGVVGQGDGVVGEVELGGEERHRGRGQDQAKAAALHDTALRGEQQFSFTDQYGTSKNVKTCQPCRSIPRDMESLLGRRGRQPVRQTDKSLPQPGSCS